MGDDTDHLLPYEKESGRGPVPMSSKVMMFGSYSPFGARLHHIR